MSESPAKLPAGAGAAATPLEIRVRRASATLEVDFDDGLRAVLPAEYLRVESPSAEVQGHGPGQKVVVAGKMGVGIESLDPIGHYAVRIRFTDGHDTGLYTWQHLHELAREREARWQNYLEELAVRGLSREPHPAARPAPPRRRR